MNSVNPSEPISRAVAARVEAARRAVLVEASEVVRLVGVDPDPPPIVIDVRAGRAGFEGYVEAHFPGALYADLETDLAEPTRAGAPARGGRHPLPSPADFARTVTSWGVTRLDQPVFLYDSAGGAMAAARLWWMMLAIGHRATRIVDGGWQALREALSQAGVAPHSGVRERGQSESGESESGERQSSDCAELPADRVADWVAEQWLLPTVDLDQVAEARGSHRPVLDVRSPVRFRGEEDPFDPDPGRIPGAHNLDFTLSLDDEGFFLPSLELRRLFLQQAEELEDAPIDQWVVHCGSGVTACHTLAAMAAAGFDLPALYVGSYSEWCRSGQPIETG